MIQRVCICGAGTMGRGIAEVFARAGLYTILYEPDQTVLEKARNSIGDSLYKLVEKNKIPAVEKRRPFNESFLQMIFISAWLM